MCKWGWCHFCCWSLVCIKLQQSISICALGFDSGKRISALLILIHPGKKISEIGVNQGINEPDAVVANRERQEPTNASFIRCSCTLQCSLEPKGWLHHILEADAHHITEILSIAVLRLQRQRGDSNSRSQQSNREAAKPGSGISQRMMPVFAWLRLQSSPPGLTPFPAA